MSVDLDERDFLPPILDALAVERDRQRDIFGTIDQNTPEQWVCSLTEQLGKVAAQVTSREHFARQVLELTTAGLACLEQLAVDAAPYDEGEALVAEWQRRRKETR
jgi:hypothetical protein